MKKKLHVPILTKFIKDLDDDDKKVFLDALSEDEKCDFCESEEEFRIVFGRDPNVIFPGDKPNLQKDAHWNDVKEDRLHERFVDVMSQFPRKKSIDTLRQLGNFKKSASGVKSIDELRKMSGIHVNVTLNLSKDEEKKKDE